MKETATGKIRFLVSKTGEDFEFKAGEVYELPMPSCQRWVRRNVAAYVEVGGLETAAVPHVAKPPVRPPTEDVEPEPVPDIAPPKKTTKRK